MLEKITNINPDSSYKGERKNTQAFPLAAKGQKHTGLGNDSISLSPSIHFLMEKNWHPVQLKEISSKKIFVDFIFSELEFKIDLDFDKVLLENKILYKIISANESDKTKTLAQIEFKPASDFTSAKYESYSTTLFSLHSLFTKITQRNLQSEANSIDTDTVRNLLEDVEHGVIEELGYITSGVLQLYEKISGVNSSQFKIGNESLSMVHILNITTINI